MNYFAEKLLEIEADEWCKKEVKISDAEFSWEIEQECIKAYVAGVKKHGISWHNLRENPEDLPPFSGDMHAEFKPVFAYTKELGITTALRFKKGKTAEWHCSTYDGNILFLDKEIIAWAEIPKYMGEVK